MPRTIIASPTISPPSNLVFERAAIRFLQACTTPVRFVSEAACRGSSLLLNGSADAVFHPAGGGHHGTPARTSGFCIFNDVVIAIKKLLEHGLQVAYVDVDAHHGDGVQDAFYSDPRVLTISLHESGDTLFPGTGDVDEIGAGQGRGYSINLPFLRGTDDEIFLRAFCRHRPFSARKISTRRPGDGNWCRRSLPRSAGSFEPDNACATRK